MHRVDLRLYHNINGLDNYYEYVARSTCRYTESSIQHPKSPPSLGFECVAPPGNPKASESSGLRPESCHILTTPNFPPRKSANGENRASFVLFSCSNGRCTRTQLPALPLATFGTPDRRRIDILVIIRAFRC